MINVIVVPETDEFKLDVSHGEEIWINPNLGIPRLKERNAKYIAPYWITKDFRGVKRIYHIIGATDYPEAFTIDLGNSFILDKPWDNMGSPRKFEYHDLNVFGLKELLNGILVPIGTTFP